LMGRRVLAVETAQTLKWCSKIVISQ